jgi:predicted Fe-Mo cluster-binding NifX family protein
MRIAISSENNLGLESPVSGHFGRCPYFTLVDVEGRELKTVESVENPYQDKSPPSSRTNRLMSC